MADLRKSLKDAKEAIGRRDYDEAAELCKAILKKDKDNYMALVFYGIALQDSEKAALAFKKAISLQGDKPLAYQGLLHHYEKLDTEDAKRKSIPIDVTLFGMETDSTKAAEILDRLLTRLKLFKDVENAKALWDSRTKFDEVKMKMFLPDFVDFLSDGPFDEPNDDLLNIYDEVENGIDSESLKDRFLLTHLNYLAKDGLVRCLPAVIGLIGKFDRTSSKEWYCRRYFHRVATSFDGVGEEAIRFAEDCAKCPLDPVVLVMVEAVLSYLRKDYISCYLRLEKLSESGAEGYDVSLLKSYCCLKLRRWNEARNTVASLPRNLDGEILKIARVIELISSVSRLSSDECARLVDSTDEFSSSVMDLNLLGRAMLFIKCRKWKEAENCIREIEENLEASYLRTVMFEEQGFPDETVRALEAENSEDPARFFPLALFYWSQRSFRKAMIPLLRAAGRDPLNYKIFLLLGHYYSKEEKDYEKAKKCYLKSYYLNPECTDSGKYLSETYRSLREWDENMEFLKKVARNKNITDPWASLEVGLHYFALHDWDNCIINLRNYVRNSPNDVSAWESLADAYFSRGSFTSALKCYRKRLEFDEKNKYTLVQIGRIQNILCQFDEALTTFSLITDEFYVPAVKGKADVYLSIAVQKSKENLFGATRHNAQRAYDSLVSALTKCSKFVCFWKTMGESVTLISALPDDFAYLDTAKGVLKGEQVFDLAVECYSSALKLEPKANTHLYYELSCVYYDAYKRFGNKLNIHKALYCIRLCLESEKSEWRFWNMLGLICMTKEIKKYNIAQHSFIKATQLDVSNSMIWSNIGILYYCVGNKILANMALKKAQQFNPDCYQSWIGQALIAESVNHDDAMDLFRHSSQLGFHRESSLGYAEWVCKSTLMSEEKLEGKTQYAISNMCAVPLAFDLMTWLYKYDKRDPCVLNIYGVLLEKMGLLNEAKNMYKTALDLVKDGKSKDIVLLNLGRALTRSGDLQNAVAYLKSISEMSFQSICVLAYCLYKNKQYEDSFQLYSSSIQWFAEGDLDKSELFVMLAALCYKSPSLGEPQAYLFPGIQQCGTTMPLLLSMFALSSLMSALPLTQLVIAEFAKKPYEASDLKYISLIKTYLQKSENPSLAIRELAKYAHRNPENHYLWQYLSKYLIGGKHHKPLISSVCAQKSIALNDCKNEVVKDIKTVSYAGLCSGDIKKCKIYAQKAIRANPEDAESWSLLLGAIISEKSSMSPKVNWILKSIDMIDKNFNPSQHLKQWLNSWNHAISMMN